jgi:hypothetical protein
MPHEKHAGNYGSIEAGKSSNVGKRDLTSASLVGKPDYGILIAGGRWVGFRSRIRGKSCFADCCRDLTSWLVAFASGASPSAMVASETANADDLKVRIPSTATR